MTSRNNVIPSETRNLLVVLEMMNGEYHPRKWRALRFWAISLRDNRSVCHTRICLASSTASTGYRRTLPDPGTCC